MKKITIFITAILFTLSAASTHGQQGKSLDEIIEMIQAKYRSVTDFYARFNQEASIKALNQVQKSEGEFWFKKPGKLRWSYHKPQKQEYVSNGYTFWFYNPQEKQVIEYPISELINPGNPTTTSSLPELLGNINTLFRPAFSDIKDSSNYVIDLIPIEETDQYNKLTIVVDKKSLMLKSLYLYDSFGNATKVILRDIKINKGIPDSVFKLDIPEGTELIKAPSLTEGH
ncbi:Outer-membrane lipoprotein carrier protein [bacterium HR37]|nr:Outer-membrane lipoprotein carrier protein [bacterium HR37]